MCSLHFAASPERKFHKISPPFLLLGGKAALSPKTLVSSALLYASLFAQEVNLVVSVEQALWVQNQSVVSSSRVVSLVWTYRNY
jgi:hypothetical protein